MYTSSAQFKTNPATYGLMALKIEPSFDMSSFRSKFENTCFKQID